VPISLKKNDEKSDQAGEGNKNAETREPAESIIMQTNSLDFPGLRMSTLVSSKIH
jgi:hypothetical protein